MEYPQQANNGYVMVAEIEVDVVHPTRSGFVMQGRGADRAEYRLEMHLEIPLDRQTQTVLGEMLAQSQWSVSRRAPAPLRSAALRRRKPVRS